jgi:O-antigen chain-terminating methyltransferase
VSETLEGRLARLEREREEADRRYNEALTALDRGLARPAAWPSPAPAYDPSRLPALNESFNVLDGVAPPAGGSLKGRLRGFVWRLVGPVFERQVRFNATLVEHLNRNVAAHEESRARAAEMARAVRAELDALLHVQALLMQYLQTVTGYVDTKDRSTGARADIVNAGLSAVADDGLKRWASMQAREDRFGQRIAGVMDTIRDVGATAAIAQQTALSLKREVERLLESAAGAAGGGASRASTPAPDLDAFKYLSFEDAFRGSVDEIRRRLAGYVRLFEGASDVLDIGCGRGEFLELLRDAGVSARGLDTNHAMVEASRARGLAVDEADALTYLRGLADASLGGLFAAQVVEHLPPAYLSELCEVAAHKIRPGGLIVLETINPACWLAFFESYIRDLTHVRPLHPETLQHLLRVSGFQQVRLEYLSPVAESTRLETLPPPPDGSAPLLFELVETVNTNMNRLNGRLFSFQDYAAIGVRS